MSHATDGRVVDVTTDKRAQTRMQTRCALRDTALSMFQARGFDAVTTTDIARETGVTQRTLFRYFATKDAILFDNLDVVDWVDSALARHADVADPRARIRLALEDLADDYDTHAQALRAVHRIVLACPRLQTAQRRHDDLIDGAMSSVIRSDVGATPALAADVAAGAIMGLMRPIIRAWLLGGLDGPMRCYADRAWPTIERVIDEGLACGTRLTLPDRPGPATE